MENTEKLISHIQMRLAQQHYVALSWELTMLDKMLKALPSYEEDKVYDIICTEAPDVEIDDTLYRTFDSKLLNVGDEVTDGEYVGVVTCLMNGEITVMMKDGSADVWTDADGWKRTGRNFQGISNILGVLKQKAKQEGM